MLDTSMSDYGRDILGMSKALDFYTYRQFCIGTVYIVLLLLLLLSRAQLRIIICR